MIVVFVSHLARPSASEAAALAPILGATEYEARMALAPTPPAIVMTTRDRDRAETAVAAIRARGHGAHAFDDAALVPSARMTRMDDFRFEPDGVRRVTGDELLLYGDVFAVLRAIHESEEDPGADPEPVAYFFRRSGATPWILRAFHSTYLALGEARTTIAFTNFTRTLARMRESAPMAVYDDRLLRRRPAERIAIESLQSSRDVVDVLAHLLAMSIASQGGSPYR
ncbi:MAG TPA: hypothetical protein VIF62_30260 [Labilithrix sp.]